MAFVRREKGKNYLLAVRTADMPNRARWGEGTQNGFTCCGCGVDMILSATGQDRLRATPNCQVICIGCSDPADDAILKPCHSAMTPERTRETLAAVRRLEQAQRAVQN